MAFNISQPGTRMVYAQAMQEMASANISADRAVLTQSELRSEFNLNVTTTSYQVPILINQNPNALQTATERRLQLQDAFVVGQIGIFITAPLTATDTTYQLLTYPSLAKFTAPQALAMNSFYNGYMMLTVNQRVLVTYWDLWKHYKINQTQASATPPPVDQVDFSSDGFFPCEPGLVHIGSTNNLMQIVLPAAVSALPTNGVKVVVIQRGVLAQNVTSVTNS